MIARLIVDEPALTPADLDEVKDTLKSRYGRSGRYLYKFRGHTSKHFSPRQAAAWIRRSMVSEMLTCVLEMS